MFASNTCTVHMIQLMDNLHFNIFHLYDVGLRVDEHEKGEFNKLRDIISNRRGQDHARFSRFRTSMNKYNIIDQSYGQNPVLATELERATWIDTLLDHLSKNNVCDQNVKELNQYIISQEHDSDSIRQDVLSSPDNSNIYKHVASQIIFEPIRDYAMYSQCMYYYCIPFEYVHTIYKYNNKYSIFPWIENRHTIYILEILFTRDDRRESTKKYKHRPKIK